MSYAMCREGLAEAKQGREDPADKEVVRRGPYLII